MKVDQRGTPPCPICASTQMLTPDEDELLLIREVLLNQLPADAQAAFWVMFDACQEVGVCADFDAILTLLAQGVDNDEDEGA